MKAHVKRANVVRNEQHIRSTYVAIVVRLFFSGLVFGLCVCVSIILLRARV